MGRLVSILALVLAGAACLPVGAQAAFGLDEFDVTFTNADGSPAAQAGSHPFAFTTSLGMNLSGEEPDGRLKELFLDLPPGLVASTTAYPRCAQEEFVDPEKSCPLETAVGSAVVSIVEPDNQETALIYNLAPPEGELMRLGFRVADTENVYVDVGLSPEPPYRLIAAMGDGPETIDVFSLEIQLWGTPSASAHDAQRGGQVSVPLGPMLTLPTSCEGPQTTFYEALSWEDDEDFGSAVTHDGAGEPMGFFGCHQLAFLPSSSAQPTTEEAQSRSGLDASFTFFDEGLANPTGIAESQVRDLILALPGGMTVDPSLASASGSCSEAGLEAETPAGGSGEGCPESSEIGTAEAESPLVEGRAIHGVIYRATPDENFAGDAAMALYIVLKDPDLGVVIAQPVGLEADPETDELIAIAEEMPQLPFGRLDLHLDDGALISPALCGKYTSKAYFETWSGEDPFVVGPSFPIGSGPNGGPCPTGDPGSQPEQTAAPSSAPGAVAASTESSDPHPASSKRRCSRGKHSIRRHGKTHCVKKWHGKHQKRGWHLR